VQVVDEGTYVQACDVVGFPPVQPEGADEITCLVFTPDAKQADQSEYVNDVQAEADG